MFPSRQQVRDYIGCRQILVIELHLFQLSFADPQKDKKSSTYIVLLLNYDSCLFKRRCDSQRYITVRFSIQQYILLSSTRMPDENYDYYDDNNYYNITINLLLIVKDIVASSQQYTVHISMQYKLVTQYICNISTVSYRKL